MSCAINVTPDLYCTIAIAALTAINTTIRTLMQSTFALSDIFFTTAPSIKSSVKVELDARTRDESVDMDAESTSIITIPISTSLSEPNISGTTASYPPTGIPDAGSTAMPEILPNPPRK